MNIEVILTNRKAAIGHCDEETEAKLRNEWSFSPHGLWYMPEYRRTKMLQGQKAETVKQIERLKAAGGNKGRLHILGESLAILDEQLETAWDGKITLLKRGCVPAGLFRATYKDVEQKCGVKFVIEKERTTVEFRDGMEGASEDYRHQNEAVAAMMKAIGRGGGLILCATGSGKTRMAAALFSKVLCPCLFVVDQLDLLYQQQKELAGWLKEEVGVVGDSKFETQRVTVATIQTLSKHRGRKDFKKWYQAINVMVVDELHEQMAKRNFDVLKAVEPGAVFGLTATMQMGQKEQRLKAFAFAGPVLYEFPISEGQKRGVLSKGAVLQLQFMVLEEGQDLAYEDELAIEVLNNEEKMDACKALVEAMIALKRHVVVLVHRVAHLESVHDMFGHIPHGLAYGDIDQEKRREAYELFEDSDIKLIIANKVMKKGVNLKRIDAMIDMAEMKSANDVVQKFGRGLRRHKDKDGFIYVDFATQGKGRFSTAAAARRRALRKAGIKVKAVKIRKVKQAVQELKKFIGEQNNG